MDLPSTLGAPRHCFIGGNVYWIRPMSMEGLAIVMNWLDDVLPGRSERKMPPKLGDDASQAALSSFPGQAMLAWLALRDSGFSYAQAAEIVPHPDDGEGEASQRKAIEHFRLMEVLMTRRRTRDKEPPPGAEDISETWCAEGMASLASEYGLTEIGKLTLDQYEWLGTAGKLDEWRQFDMQAKLDALPGVVAAYEAAMAAGNGEVIPSTP